ncbi:MAG: acylphosphatase [Candidatus Margulisiibacteriota bacterium]
MQKRVEVHYAGRVQGVGFRFTAERLAAPNGLTGFVRNLPDDRVELVLEGEEEAIKTVLEMIRREFDREIDTIADYWLEPTGEFKRFNIKNY